MEGKTIDREKLLSWVERARHELEASGHKKIGDDQLGKFLSHCPDGDDGVWPHESVREIVEKLRSHEFDVALQVGRANARGVTSRSMYSGGDQERELAQKYRADAERIKLKWPRTADILRDLAKSYEYDAAREDKDVELRE
jgi:hypothetical protein